MKTDVMNPQEAPPAETGAERNGTNGTAKARLPLLASGGAILSAFLASACCIGPLVFALLGLGGAGLLLKFEPYRPYFIAVTVLLLGAGFYVTYRRPKAAAAGATCDCPAPRTHRAGRIMLWVSTVLVAGFLIFPYLAPLLFG